MHLGQLNESRIVFDMMKDVAEDCYNWGHAMQAYEWIGRVLCL